MYGTFSLKLAFAVFSLYSAFSFKFVDTIGYREVIAHYSPLSDSVPHVIKIQVTRE